PRKAAPSGTDGAAVVASGFAGLVFALLGFESNAHAVLALGERIADEVAYRRRRVVLARAHDAGYAADVLAVVEPTRLSLTGHAVALPHDDVDRERFGQRPDELGGPDDGRGVVALEGLTALLERSPVATLDLERVTEVAGAAKRVQVAVEVHVQREPDDQFLVGGERVAAHLAGSCTDAGLAFHPVVLAAAIAVRLDLRAVGAPDWPGFVDPPVFCVR